MRYRNWKHSVARQLTLAIGAFLCFSMPSHAAWVGDSRPLMGTEVRVFLWFEDQAEGAALVEAAFDEIERINAVMSTYIETSLISEVNRDASTRPVDAGDELFPLVQRALDISILTRGAFDITYDSVGQHYDFRERKRPDEETVNIEKGRIDFRLVEMDPEVNTIRFLEDGVRINLGGIAKGYAVERGAAVLEAAGVRHGIVTAGGDSQLIGDRRGRPWMIGIRDPREDGQVAISVPLEGEAISTSGDYERYFDEDGIRYHHILSPDSGEPAAGVHSATVFGPDAVMTDALSTSVFVMGVDAGLKLIACLPDYESIVIDNEGKIYYSNGLAQPGAPLHDQPTSEPVPGTC